MEDKHVFKAPKMPDKRDPCLPGPSNEPSRRNPRPHRQSSTKRNSEQSTHTEFSMEPPPITPRRQLTDEEWEELLGPTRWLGQPTIDLTEFFKTPIYGAGLAVPLPGDHINPGLDSILSTKKLEPTVPTKGLDPIVPTKVFVLHPMDHARNCERKEEELYKWEPPLHPQMPREETVWSKKPLYYQRRDDGTLYVPEYEKSPPSPPMFIVPSPPTDVPGPAPKVEKSSSAVSRFNRFPPTPELSAPKPAPVQKVTPVAPVIPSLRVPPPEIRPILPIPSSSIRNTDCDIFKKDQTKVAPTKDLASPRMRPSEQGQPYMGYSYTDLFFPAGSNTPIERRYGTNRSRPFFSNNNTPLNSTAPSTSKTQASRTNKRTAGTSNQRQPEHNQPDLMAASTKRSTRESDSPIYIDLEPSAKQKPAQQMISRQPEIQVQPQALVRPTPIYISGVAYNGFEK
ncbi:hypothetical protein CAEBREN_24296 [Caenorhabditis brenneri]|uniref:Uncharacterized protein n=1 Tax=Caenorhabditis brenneri TaxID=135651 RepID=G0MH49_CAEBE|nr:hypothetical protein CAEBREN_24296 [Caenorhabditis brenneri]